jgi:hypothetical protein
MIFFTFLTAIALSGIAAYYSVIGLTSIFVGAFWPIIFMGATLEVAKLVTTSWLYRNWNTSPKLFRHYLTFSVLILMLITSMGIFGFLSKAHIEQSASSGDVVAKVALIDERIRIEKDNIEASKLAIKQLDEAVNQVMGRSTDQRGAEKSVQIRRSQQKERSVLLSEISQAQKKINEYTEEKTPLAASVRKLETEIGPLKYVADVFYGTGSDSIDKAVRLVILLIMIVFDPLAILLLVAANMSMVEKKKKDIAEPIVTEMPQEFNIPEPDNEEPPESLVKIFQQGLERDRQQSVQIDKDNLAFVIDETSGESIPPFTGTTKGLLPEKDPPISKKLEPKYDYNEAYSFREKGKK